jgi:hypothetical protein
MGIRLKIWILFGCLLAITGCQNESRISLDLQPRWDTSRVLENPHKGWYHHHLDNRIDRYGIDDDPVYLEKLDNFQQSFAERYDGKPWVSYVDIGSIGEWGEGHTSFSTRIPPTVAEVKANMDIFLKHFQTTQLVVTDDLLYYGKPDHEVRELLDYAIRKYSLKMKLHDPATDENVEMGLREDLRDDEGYYFVSEVTI